QELRRGERALNLFSEVVTRREVLLVTKDGTQPLGYHTVGGQLAGERARHPEPLELVMKPVGGFLVFMAVAEEGVEAGPQPAGAAQRRRLPFRIAVKSRQSGKLDHRPPPAGPVKSVNTKR